MKINSLWSLFTIIVMFMGLLVSTILYMKYDDVKSKIYASYEYDNKALHQTLHSNFVHYESLLSLLGKQLLADSTYKNTQKSIKILNSLLSMNEELLGFGLTDSDGNFIALSSNMDPAKMPNLAEANVTGVSFKAALQSNSMVVGRTYLLKKLNTWVIPIRKAIRNADGTVLGVMTAGIKIHTPDGLLSHYKLTKNRFIGVAKDYDANHQVFRSYFSKLPTINLSDVYNVPVPKTIYDMVSKRLFENNQIDLEELKRRAKSYHETYMFQMKNAWGTDVIASISYDADYRLFYLIQGLSSIVMSTFLLQAVSYVLIYILFFIFTYFLFRYIIKQEHNKKSLLKFQATHDELTQLPNRTFMYNNFNAWSKKHAQHFEILYLDLDNFKSINDSFGHKIGDLLLIEVAQRLKQLLINDDMLIRQGGDEFIIIHDNVASDNDKYYKNIIHFISQTYHIEAMEFSLGVSIGICDASHSQNLDELLSLADISMYEAKKQKNSYSVFNSKMQSLQSSKITIEHALRHAIENNEIFMHYQPQLRVDGTLYGVEALVRWKSEKLGFITPDVFIPVAEESGIIVELSHFIMNQAVNEIYTLQEELQQQFHLSINLSVKQIFSENFLQNTLQTLECFSDNLHLITLEITERLFIEDINYILPILHKIKSHKIELSLDDFGTGYSSLSLLRKLPIDELKIDKSFVDEILQEKEAEVLSNSIVKMGNNLHMTTVAEGVETKEQVTLLKSQGCQIFQGYYFSKPLDIATLKHFIQNLSLELNK